MTLQELYECVTAANPEYLHLPLYVLGLDGSVHEVEPNDFDAVRNQTGIQDRLEIGTRAGDGTDS